MTQFDILDWQQEYAERAKQDHQELVQHLSAMQAKQDLTNDTLRDNNDMLRNLMTMMQTVRASMYTRSLPSLHVFR